MAGAVVLCESDIKMRRTSYFHAAHQDVEDVDSKLQLPHKSMLLVLNLRTLYRRPSGFVVAKPPCPPRPTPTALFNVQRAFSIGWQGIIAAAVASPKPHECSDIHVKCPPAV